MTGSNVPSDLLPETVIDDAAKYARQKHHPLKAVPHHALLASRMALFAAQQSGDADAADMIGPVADAILAAGLDVIFTEDTVHLINITWDHSDPDNSTYNWKMQHPLSCRPRLFTCPVDRAVNAEHLKVWANGTYVCELNDTGKLLITGRVSN